MNFIWMFICINKNTYVRMYVCVCVTLGVPLFFVKMSTRKRHYLLDMCALGLHLKIWRILPCFIWNFRYSLFGNTCSEQFLVTITSFGASQNVSLGVISFYWGMTLSAYKMIVCLTTFSERSEIVHSRLVWWTAYLCCRSMYRFKVEALRKHFKTLGRSKLYI